MLAGPHGRERYVQMGAGRSRDSDGVDPLVGQHDVQVIGRADRRIRSKHLGARDLSMSHTQVSRKCGELAKFRTRFGPPVACAHYRDANRPDVALRNHDTPAWLRMVKLRRRKLHRPLRADSSAAHSHAARTAPSGPSRLAFYEY